MKWHLPKPTADFMGVFGLPTLDRSMVIQALWCFGLALVPHSFHLVPWVLGMALVVAAWRWASLRKQVRLPPNWFFVAAIPVLLVGVAASYGTVIGRDGGTALLCSFFCLKMLELRNRKDFLVVVGTSYALILAAVLFSQSLPMCLYLIFQFLFTTSCLVRLHGQWNASGDPRGFRLAASILLKSLPLALVLFVFFPRIDAQLRFSPFDPASGFSESMAPGSIAGATGDRSMAFRATFPDGNIPEQADLYWRGVILGRTADGMSWERVGFGISGPVPRVSDREPLSPDEVVYEISLIPSFQRWVFALDYPKAWPGRGERHLGGVVGWPYKIRSRLKYEVVSEPGYHSREINPELRELFLQLPEPRHLTERVKRLVEGWKAGSGNDREVVQRALQFFHEEGFAYTLRPGTYRQRPLDTFLFERKRGFCEHFSGALATTLRMAGIPSRVVLGFHGGEYNAYGDFLLVRKQHAHSWVEVWLEDQGWTRVDPTGVIAPVRLSGGFRMLREMLGAGWLLRFAGMEFELFPPGWLPEPVGDFFRVLSDRLENLNRIWDEWLGYDYGAQIQLMQKIGVGESPLNALVAILVGISACIVLTFALLTFRSRRAALPEDRIFQQLERKLRTGGWKRDPVEGVATFLGRVGQHAPGVQGQLNQILDLYHETKFRILSEDQRQNQLRKLDGEVRRFRWITPKKS